MNVTRSSITRSFLIQSSYIFHMEIALLGVTLSMVQIQTCYNLIWLLLRFEKLSY